MSKETFLIKDIDTKVLLHEILRRSVKNDNHEGDEKLFVCDDMLAPTKIKHIIEHFEVIVGIGKDNYAKIYLTSDDVKALNKLLENKEAE
jgi:hypothetical protein